MDAKTPDEQTSPYASEWDGLSDDEIREKVQINSIARFLECEKARKTALDAGQDANAADDAAKAIWNAWASAINARREALESSGTWQLDEYNSQIIVGNYIYYANSLSSVMRDWLLDAATDFSKHRFDCRDKAVMGEMEKSQSDTSEAEVKPLFVEANHINFSGFIFPGDAHFRGATFTGDAHFRGATFTGDAYFSDATFTSNATFWDATFTSNATFWDAKFTGDATFSDAIFTKDANFSRATFTGDATFWDAKFTGDAYFPDATFTGDAYFSDATFTSNAYFSDASFTGLAYFHNTKFTGGNAIFFRVRLDKDAAMNFIGAVFGEAQDPSNRAIFEEARFDGPVKFVNVTFHGPTSFRSMRSEISFRLEKTEFAMLPDFREVRIEHRPELDGMTIDDPFINDLIPDGKERPKNIPKDWNDPRPAAEAYPRWWRWIEKLSKASMLYMAYAPDPDTVAKYRALRGLAMKANDHELEMDAFANEIRAQRFREHLPFDFRKGKAGRFWIGFLYQHVANFGRSFWRPLGLWAGLTATSFILNFLAYLPGPITSDVTRGSIQTSDGASGSIFNIDWPRPPKFPYSENPLDAFMEGTGYAIATAWAFISAIFLALYQAAGGLIAFAFNMPCQSAAEGITPLTSAVTLAVKNALLFLGGISIERSRQATMCLYGRWDEVTGETITLAHKIDLNREYQFEPLIPWYISTLGSVQTLLSIILFFLFLLAVRNHFKIHD